MMFQATFDDWSDWSSDKSVILKSEISDFEVATQWFRHRKSVVYESQSSVFQALNQWFSYNRWFHPGHWTLDTKNCKFQKVIAYVYAHVYAKFFLKNVFLVYSVHLAVVNHSSPRYLARQ